MMKILLVMIAVSLMGCASSQQKLMEQNLMAVNWFQTAGEVKALQYQAYSVAKFELWKALKKTTRKPKAIVVDIDETVLDNSPFQAQSIKDGTSYPVGWKEWVFAAQAKPIPGAVEFLNYAAKRGVVTFYVSNRRAWGLEPTYKNLKAVGFPVKKENILLKTTTSNKEPRRQKILKKYDIILFFGDNLGDFAESFEHKTFSERSAEVDKLKQNFGHKFIVLPNPMYGSWEGAMAKGYFKMDAAQKSEVRHQRLKTWK